MGNFEKNDFIKTKHQKEMFEKLYKIAAKKRWTKLFKEQWAIGIVTYLKSDDDFNKIFELLNNGEKDVGIIQQTAFLISYKRQHPSYVKNVLKI